MFLVKAFLSPKFSSAIVGALNLRRLIGALKCMVKRFFAGTFEKSLCFQQVSCAVLFYHIKLPALFPHFAWKARPQSCTRLIGRLVIHHPHTPSTNTILTHRPRAPSTHTAHTHRPRTPPTHTAHAHRPRTPPTHTAHAHRPRTPPTHTAHAHRPRTPPTHTAHAHRPRTPPTHIIHAHHRHHSPPSPSGAITRADTSTYRAHSHRRGLRHDYTHRQL